MKSRYDIYSAKYPLLPLKNVVVFPKNVVTLLVGKRRSIQAVEDAMGRDRRIVVVSHRNAGVDDPAPEDLYQIGTLAEVISIEHQQGGNIQVALEGLHRVDLVQWDMSKPIYSVRAEQAIETRTDSIEVLGLVSHIQDLARQFQESKSVFSSDAFEMIQATSDPSHLSDLLTTQLVRDAGQRQAFLENVDPCQRLEMLAVHLTKDLDLAALEQRIKDRVREQIDKNQREYYLREQLKVIHDELSGDAGNEIEALRQKVKDRGMPEKMEEKLLKEVSRLERMPTVSAEGTVVRNYIDTVLALPWYEQTEDNLDLERAEEILNKDHHGLDQVKERILEFLAVRKLTADRGRMGASILCLVGPPGVGKTSLGTSIAEAMGRKMVRVSLGGVRDEAEIRGHRRTYIGAFPGRVLNAMKTAGTLNPVVILDEIDKMASDYRGDPAAAMLEVLDPEQNYAFNDHYLDAGYDLSKVLFITTANSLYNIPRPLRDRMEVIEISGYTEHEKIEIGRRHLLPKQLEAHGLEPSRVEISEKLWHQVIRNYTREAGVRNLERQIAAICRKVACGVVKGRSKRMRLTQARLVEYLGPPRYGFEHSFNENQVGVAIGLGTTDVGGELIPVEVAVMPGRGNLTITGRAGDVMQESARAALSYARSRAVAFGIEPDFQEKKDVHIHLPEGATPKDGPSAGITMATALISALSKRPVRADVAMTGEITLRGRVLPIGGLKDKALAAHRVGIRRLIVPTDNERDHVKIPEKIAGQMEFIWVENMDQVIAQALDFTERAEEIDPTLKQQLQQLPVSQAVPEINEVAVEDVQPIGH
jgi:ATP-dependent Lon protease